MESNKHPPMSSASQGTTGGSSQSPEGSYAFLVHSQDSVSRNTPPDIDNQPLVRQKRRRTSPEDHAILEAEYERNSKPDKAARIAIVNRVALGEKEVQVSESDETTHVARFNTYPDVRGTSSGA
ncbi:MAG: hypothetical protein Q9161_001294 [Pseudevernia consocians]